jgi:hypothetical protein
MTDNIRAALERLIQVVKPEYNETDEIIAVVQAITAARAALAAAPEGEPSDEELALIYHDCCGGCEFMDQGGFEDAARAILSRWGRPAAPPAPLEGEVGELVAWIHRQAVHGPDADEWRRAATLLEQLSAAAPAVVPVAVSERPWEREGWCDAEGRFWAEHISRSGVAAWRCAAASDLGGWAVRCLPAHALPLPAPQGGEVEG